jgi:hypothetical protein
MMMKTKMKMKTMRRRGTKMMTGKGTTMMKNLGYRYVHESETQYDALRLRFLFEIAFFHRKTTTRTKMMVSCNNKMPGTFLIQQDLTMILLLFDILDEDDEDEPASKKQKSS